MVDSGLEAGQGIVWAVSEWGRDNLHIKKPLIAD